MLILGIETSCDDTSVALVENGYHLVAHRFASQIEVHRAFGGVVPELASRAHLDALPRTLEACLKDSGRSIEDVDAVAATYGPGLVGALLVGLMAGKSLAASLSRPFIAVNHLQAHLAAARLGRQSFGFPFLGLLVSGGHTLIARFETRNQVKVLGRTRDDAAGEAFDKLARAMGLGYPGGRPVQERARRGNASVVPLPRRVPFPGTLDFSFSGLKTAVLRQIHGGGQTTDDLCAALQASIVRALVEKMEVALAVNPEIPVVLAGGVAANEALRAGLRDLCASLNRKLILPDPILCTDNGAMVAARASWDLEEGDVSPLDEGPCPNLAVDALPRVRKLSESPPHPGGQL